MNFPETGPGWTVQLPGNWNFEKTLDEFFRNRSMLRPGKMKFRKRSWWVFLDLPIRVQILFCFNDLSWIENCCGLLNLFLVQVNSTFLSFFDIWISVLLVGFRSVLTLLVQNQKIPIWPIIRLYLTNIRPVADRPSKYLVGSKTWIS